MTHLFTASVDQTAILEDGIPVQETKSYGIGIDCHSKFIQVCVLAKLDLYFTLILDIPVSELPSIEPDFKRYILIIQEHDIHTTSLLVTAYLSCSLGSCRGSVPEI